MSLTLALGSATASLRTIQSELALAANNIANADTEGYSVKSATKVNTTTGGSGIGTGVDIIGISSKVDANLLKSIITATSANAEAATDADYLDRLAEILGQLTSSDSGGGTLSASLTELAATLEELAATPESDTLKTQAVLQLTDAAASLRDTSAQVQDLRAEADDGIESAVASVNESLHAIDSLNDSIVLAQSRGESTADLEDQRMVLVAQLSTQMDISYYTGEDGAMTIYTGGQPLLNSSVHELSYQASNTVTSETVYPGGFDAITLNGQDITTSVKSGTIAALVELRDDTLPAVQDQLDAIATDLRDQMNALSNQGSASPAPQSLTGTVAGLAGTDAIAGTGTLRVGLVDSDGSAQTLTDIDMSTITSVDDLLGALNAIAGVSASLDADGQLVVESTDASLGIALSGGDVGGKSVSGYFGLNDMLTGDGAEDLFVNASLAADPTLLAVGSLGDNGIGLDGGALAQAMADAIDTSAATDLVADIGAKSKAADSIATSRETTLTALTDSFSSRYGVNIDEETAHISELENAYSASAQVLSAIQEMFDSLLNAVS
ncbi:putative flagellar hook-associated protein flgK [Magnetospirillum gryphiswaldense MSR-1 v2]|uniref:Flagellar hook-associated protein 1 n=1 Tax=Magnetospirillum gryphiswaldense (strain DSM 6361 / JCM 21280 / NBRC 15271 / MSR-1) TaxID=431944 RepID=V6EW57_MAGGM|nr:flagellar hook-associated protein FlgK [Magnetospirillum gryphiswaldense]CDK97307.1 putative flagellar hook-associated protein flgK [Magnetospirillum gryphiswaldense MSR-1 v2]